MQHLVTPSKITINSIIQFKAQDRQTNKTASSTNNFTSGGITKTRTDWQSYCAILASKVALQQEHSKNDVVVVNNNHSTLGLLPVDKILKPLTISDLPPAPNSTLRVAYHCAYTKLAVGKAFPECEPIPCNESVVAFRYVEDRIADRAVLPLENSITGSIYNNYDLLLRHRLHIIGEFQLKSKKIQDNSSSVTRFITLAREPVVPTTDRGYKTSIVFAQDEGTSGLFKVLSAFEFRDIKLTNIECRPNRSRPVRVVQDANGGTAKHFEYMFYIEFEGSMAEERAQNAVAEVEEFTSFLRVLGSYPMDVGTTTRSTLRED